MIKRKAIYDTAVCYWDEESECFCVESPLFDRVLGAAATETEAWKMFARMLEDMYEELAADRVAGYKRGRPAKGGVDLHVQVKPETKELIDKLRGEHGISQGEQVDVAVFSLYWAKEHAKKNVTDAAADRAKKPVQRTITEPAEKLGLVAAKTARTAKSLGQAKSIKPKRAAGK
jgi:hypothetical protein